MSKIQFTKEHEWILMKDNIGLVGITDFAQKQLGDIVSVELPSVGNEFKQNDAMAIIDSVKASSDIYCPCLLYTSPSPRDRSVSRMPSSA